MYDDKAQWPSAEADHEMTKTILQDLEWERENALNTGCRPETAFTTMLIHGAADFLSNEWDGAELKHLVAALWDVLNSEMSRIEAEEERSEELRQKVGGLQRVMELVQSDVDKAINCDQLREIGIERAFAEISKQGKLHNGVWHTHEEIAAKAGLPGWGSPATPPAPEPEAVASQEQNAAPEPEKPSAETDDFLNPGRAFTKNIMRDWGQL